MTVSKRANARDIMFGRYRLCGRLAAGGMAEVWAAQLLAPGGFVKPMVIKRVLPELAENQSFMKMLMTEARVAARLSHANVCSVFELGEVDREYYIAMEYLRGAPLSHLLKNGGPLPPEMAVALVAQACDGLHYAHEQRDQGGNLLGLVHRDVSPHNLFVTVDGVVKVLDFGIAKVDDGISERTEEGKVKGKLTYMSPEQLAAESLDRRTDVWALGVVLWELLTGKRLFGGGGPADTVDGIRNAKVPKLAGLGPVYARLDAVIFQALRVERPQRFATAAELRRAMLEALLPDQPATTDHIVHVVWERCGNEVRVNDRRFDDDGGDTDMRAPTAATSSMLAGGNPMDALDRLPLRAEETEPSIPSVERMLGAEALNPRAAMPTVADWRSPATPAVDTSPEIEVVRATTPAPLTTGVTVLPSSAPVPVVAGFGEPAPASPWRAAAIAILVIGAVAIAVLWWTRTSESGKKDAKVVATAGSEGSEGEDAEGEGKGKGKGTGKGSGSGSVTTVTELGGGSDADPGSDSGSGSETGSGSGSDTGSGSGSASGSAADSEPAIDVGPVQIEEPAPEGDKPEKKRTPIRRPPPPRPGKLFLDARPYATIYMDGRKLGVTPLLGVTVPSGDHTIKAVAEDGRTKTMRISIPAGGDARRKITW
jgi:serine/threonine protein kinase